MYRQFFAGMEFTALPLFALALFIVFFALVAVRVFALRGKKDFDAVASLPLHDEPEFKS
jgi:cbb3-type cytochrome oxidase subunit 3